MLKLFDKYGKAFRQLSNNYFPIRFICNVRKNINKKMAVGHLRKTGMITNSRYFIRKYF